MEYKITLPKDGKIERLHLVGIVPLERGIPVEMTLTENQAKSIRAHGATVTKKTKEPAPEPETGKE